MVIASATLRLSRVSFTCDVRASLRPLMRITSPRAFQLRIIQDGAARLGASAGEAIGGCFLVENREEAWQDSDCKRRCSGAIGSVRATAQPATKPRRLIRLSWYHLFCRRNPFHIHLRQFFSRKTVEKVCGSSPLAATNPFKHLRPPSSGGFFLVRQM